MKKLVAISIMAAMLLAIGVAAMANETNWKMYLTASSAAGTGAGSSLTVGTASATQNGKDASDVAGTFTSTGVANAMSFNTGVEAGKSLYTADMRAPMASQTNTPKSLSWDVYAWRMQGATFNDMKLVWTVGTISGPSNNLPAATFGGVPYFYTLEVINDPTGQNTGYKWTSAGWTANPSPNLGLALNWTNLGETLKGDEAWAVDTDKDPSNGLTPGAVQLRLTVAPAAVVTPEPSSMLALASGIFGMAGFAIRRRK